MVRQVADKDNQVTRQKSRQAAVKDNQDTRQRPGQAVDKDNKEQARGQYTAISGHDASCIAGRLIRDFTANSIRLNKRKKLL